jgi:hypothetical protein
MGHRERSPWWRFWGGAPGPGAAGSADPIEAFWAFWHDSELAMGEAIEHGTLSEWVEPISTRVAAIDDRLQWEFGRGRGAQHYFCLAAPGDARLRIVAERWRGAGPPDGPLFEFYPARPATGFQPGAILTYEDVPFLLDEFRILAVEDDVRERLDVRVYHPAFSGTTEAIAGSATFIALDGALGEDEVERWLGDIERSRDPLPGATELGGLRERVTAFGSRATGERWVLLEGKRPSGQPALATVNRALKRVEHLLLDTHYTVTLPVLRPTPGGLPDGVEHEELVALEDGLFADLGPDAVRIARETFEGKRLVHLHASATGPVPDRLERWCRAQAREVELSAADDPDWAVLRRW